MNFSAVWGNGLPPAILAQRPEAAGHKFFATETSMVLHPRNPYVPTVHYTVEVVMQSLIWYTTGEQFSVCKLRDERNLFSCL